MLTTSPSCGDDRDDSGSSEGKRRGALLPSELKKLLRSKRSKSTPTPPSGDKSSCIRVTSTSTSVLSLAPSGRIPLGKISLNVPKETGSLPPAPVILPERPTLSYSLLTQITISCGSQISHWKHKTASGHGDLLNSYRFPYPDLPLDAPLKLRKLLSLNPAQASGPSAQGNLLPFEQAYFKTLLESWRRALLSLYDLFRSRRCKYFYYIQPDHVILFRRHSVSDAAEAVIARATQSLLNSLKVEGIPFEGAMKESQSLTQNDYDEEPGPLEGNSDPEDDPYESSTDAPSGPTPDARAIKAAINRRVNRTRRRASSRTSTAAPNVIVRGEGSVHALVDYLLNQRDGRSYVIIPQLLSPVPFLFGTQTRAELAINGPLDDGNPESGDLYQVRVNGLLLPSLQEDLIRETYRPNDGHFKLTTTMDPRTEPFLTLLQDKIDS